MCFITGDSDETCSLESLAALRPQLASWDVRAAFVPVSTTLWLVHPFHIIHFLCTAPAPCQRLRYAVFNLLDSLQPSLLADVDSSAGSPCAQWLVDECAAGDCGQCMQNACLQGFQVISQRDLESCLQQNGWPQSPFSPATVLGRLHAMQLPCQGLLVDKTHAGCLLPMESGDWTLQLSIWCSASPERLPYQTSKFDSILGPVANRLIGT